MSGPPGKKSMLALKVKNDMATVYQGMMRGVPQHELATRLGVSTKRIADLKKRVREEWITGDGLTVDDMQQKLTERIAALNHIKQVAYESFERSRADAQRKTISEQICPKCKGKCVGPDAWDDCELCDGEGTIKHLSKVRAKGTAGDASFLKLAKDCEVEIGKLQGLYQKAELILNQVNINTNKALALEAQQLDPEAIIQARTALDALQTPLTIEAK